MADFTLSGGASAKVGGVAQISKNTANDFTNPVTYRVTAEDESVQNWLVTVNVAPAPRIGKDITSYSIPGQVNSIIDSSAHTVTVTMPSGTDVSSLVADFTLSGGASSEVGGVAQISKKTANDFRNPVTYRVTAEDKSVQNWVVTVNVAPAPRIGKDITSYSLPGQVGSIIDSSAHTVTVTMPSGTDVSSLVADFTLSDGASAEVGSLIQESGVTANDFTSPVPYKIIAEDKSFLNWAVTVYIGTDPVTPVIPKVEPSDIEPFKLGDDDVSSDTGAKPMTAGETADIVNGNGDLLNLFSEDKVAEIVAVKFDGNVKDIKIPVKKDYAKNVTDIAVKYEGSVAITPVIAQIKNDGSLGDGDNFDFSLPVAQIRSLMTNISNNVLTFRLRIASKDSVIMFRGRNLVAERLATVEEKDGFYYVVLNVSNRPGAGLTFDDLSGSVFAVEIEDHLIQSILEKIGSRNYSYQDLVNMGLLNLDSAKWYEYKSEIDKLVDPVKDDIQKAIDAINTAKPVPASSGSGGSGCSIGGIAPAAFFLLLPLFLLQKK
ncbi:MAG: Synerg-CTERM sorting domain-containing protein [Synergistota bacterium]|nr:Synerg-CTERM sorting domain-containing protein [Synergistota bacterium]